MVDEDPTPGRFLITRSQNLAVADSVSQSLAGRTMLLELLPLDLEEIRRFPSPPQDVWQVVWSGGYPRIYERGLRPDEWRCLYGELPRARRAPPAGDRRIDPRPAESDSSSLQPRRRTRFAAHGAGQRDPRSAHVAEPIHHLGRHRPGAGARREDRNPVPQLTRDPRRQGLSRQGGQHLTGG